MKNDEIATIRAELKTRPEWMRTAFEIAIHQGCRLSETSLPMEMVELNRMTITFSAKGRGGGEKHVFTTKLHPALVPLLAKLKKSGARVTCRAWPRKNFIFSSRRLGSRTSASTARALPWQLGWRVPACRSPKRWPSWDTRRRLFTAFINASRRLISARPLRRFLTEMVRRNKIRVPLKPVVSATQRSVAPGKRRITGVGCGNFHPFHYPRRDAEACGDPHRQISVRIGSKERANLCQAARRTDASIGELVRAALEQLPEKPARTAKSRGRR